MYGKPSPSPAVPILTVVVIAFLTLYAVLAIAATQIAMRCGPACSVLMGSVHP
jgi:hypothetical protein